MLLRIYYPKALWFRPALLQFFYRNMLGNFEKYTSLIANIITIITFVLSICNWLGFGFIADTSIPNARAAKSVLCIYCCFASYGQANALDEHANKNDNSILLWCILSFSYVFGFLFLLEKARIVLHITGIQDFGPIALAWTANTFIMYLVFCFKRMHPKGGVIAFVRNYFSGLKAYLLWIGHMVGLAMLFMVLH